MSIDTSKWKSEIDRTTADFKNAFAGLSEGELNWKPDAKTWSIAQNLDHLIVINSSYYPLITKAQQNQLELPWLGKVKFVYSMIGKMILDASGPDRRKKISTFPVWMPAASNISADILDRFEVHQSELKQMIDNCMSLLLNNAVIYSPANRMIVYKLSTAFDIIVAHERRHLNQAMEILDLMRSKNS